MTKGRVSKIEEGNYFGADAPEIIQLCLACTKETCTNCMDWTKKKAKAARKREEKTEEVKNEP